MRLFVAAELPEPLIEALAETSALLRDSVKGRYVAPDSFHVTLAFLGDVPGSRVDAAAQALDAGCAGFAPFDVSFGQLGSFGKRSAATLWQGFGNQGNLEQLARSVRDRLDGSGFSFDDKPFKAHITLMRKADLRDGFLPAPARGTGCIEHVTLFRSDLSGSRPIYEPLHIVQLS